MSEGKIETIESVAQYLKFLRDNSATKGIPRFYRGENSGETEFSERVASAYRKDENGNYKYPNHIQMVKRFHIEVANRISETEEKNFLAFAQHHDIPTKLVDVTWNPLAALWFACENYKNKKDSKHSGFVHVFDSQLCNITKTIQENPFCPIEILLASKDDTLIRDFMESDYMFDDGAFVTLHKYVELLKEWNRSIAMEDRTLGDIPTDYLTRRYNNSLTDEERINLRRDTLHLNREYELVGKKIHEYAKGRIEPNDTVVYLILLLYVASNADDRARQTLSYELLADKNLLPLFAYKPDKTFERERAQSGFFIVQEQGQRITPTKMVRVKKAPNIIKELDVLGVNKATLFCSYDYIADYVKESFETEQ